MASFLRNSLILTICLASCYSPKKAAKQVAKAAKYPEIVAAQCAQQFPNTVTHDTVTNTEYDFIEVMCEDRYIVKDSVTLQTDTITKYVTRKVQAPTQVITVTNTVTDSAEVFKLKAELAALLQEAQDKSAIGGNLVKFIGLMAFLILGFFIKRNGKPKHTT